MVFPSFSLLVTSNNTFTGGPVGYNAGGGGGGGYNSMGGGSGGPSGRRY